MIFYDNLKELTDKLTYFSENAPELKELTQRGNSKVKALKVDYNSIISALLAKIDL